MGGGGGLRGDLSEVMTFERGFGGVSRREKSHMDGERAPWDRQSALSEDLAEGRVGSRQPQTTQGLACCCGEGLMLHCRQWRLLKA